MFNVPHLSEWRRESLRTNLWVLPTAQVLAALALFVLTYTLDKAAYSTRLTLPSWVNAGGADAARQVLAAIAATVITVVGLVFSIVIVALTLTSTQFGPRMLRNFIRDRGTQLTLGTFVATFVYAVLTLGAVGHGRADFVPHLSVTVALALVLASSGVLIFFIHHVATSIQLPEVIAGIARDLSAAIDVAVVNDDRIGSRTAERGLSLSEVRTRLEQDGATVPATTSGYLQFVVYDSLVDIASEAGAVIQLLNRPGHFIVAGLPLARVWPKETADQVSRRLARSHATGSHRTLSQDLAFAIDQLVEIAIRALSPAVNDTFTALTCIDWLGDALCKLSARWQPTVAHRDGHGSIRVLTADLPYDRFVERAFDKIRQAGRGMPAVMIRQLDTISKIIEYATSAGQLDALVAQAEMIRRSSEESVPEEADRLDVRRRYDVVCAAVEAK